MKSIICSIFTILILSTYTVAQEIDSWITFNTNNGLAQNYISTVCESSDGAIWIYTF